MSVCVTVSVDMSFVYSILRTVLLDVDPDCLTGVHRRGRPTTRELAGLGGGMSHPLTSVLALGAVTRATNTTTSNTRTSVIFNDR